MRPQSFHPFRPRLLDSLQGYTRQRFFTDLGAGITVGVVALPLAMAFAIASGVKPEQGLFTAIIAGLLISALGGSHVQIGGPAGAFIVIVYGIVERYGLANLLIATAMAGVLMFLMGWFKLGRWCATCRCHRHRLHQRHRGADRGVAAEGLLRPGHAQAAGGLLLADIGAGRQHAGSLNPVALGLGVVSLALVVLWPKSYAMPTAPAWCRASCCAWPRTCPAPSSCWWWRRWPSRC
jgi:SulP family sulfate permease